MSYEIIKHIKVDEKQEKVLINGASNNVQPRDYHYWECHSLEKILQEQGREALDVEILKTYESGSFQGGKNKYTSALERLRHMPEYTKFNWRLSGMGKEYEEQNKLRKSKAFDELLLKALKEKNPKEKYVITKMYGMTKVWAYKQTKRRLFWTPDFKKAKIFHWKVDAENLKGYFTGSFDWQVEKLNTQNDCSKTVTRENAYEIWQSFDKSWTWYVLKKWQKHDDKPNARWFCDVITPMCPDGELGDVFVREIKRHAIRIK